MDVCLIVSMPYSQFLGQQPAAASPFAAVPPQAAYSAFLSAASAGPAGSAPAAAPKASAYSAFMGGPASTAKGASPFAGMF